MLMMAKAQSDIGVSVPFFDISLPTFIGVSTQESSIKIEFKNFLADRSHVWFIFGGSQHTSTRKILTHRTLK